MYNALSHALRRHDAAILIGTDCPLLAPQDLRRAARLLRGGCDVVLAPAEDGGYALIGARRISPGIFEGIPWGGANVYAATVERLLHSGYRWRALRELWDLDRPEDLDRLRSLRFSSAFRRSARR